MTPSLVVIHYTAISCDEARSRLCDPLAEVSAHWLISQTGTVEALVDESQRAWHAGAGMWAGQDDINSHSIGIELANDGAQPFAEPQMAALETLLRGIMARWSIAPHRVIGHSDMAPSRKSDPGARFDWRRLALQGLSIWPDDPMKSRTLRGEAPTPTLTDSPTLNDSLTRFGYPEAPDAARLAAFRLRFRPWAQGAQDAQDRALAANLAQRFGTT